MKVLVLTEFGRWSASTRYRALQHLPALRDELDQVDILEPNDRPNRRPGRAGQAVFFAAHGSRYIRRWREVRTRIHEYDAVLVQRALYPMGPAWVVRPLEGFRGRVVLDLDDDVFSVKPAMLGRGSATRWLYGSHQTRAVVQRADAIVVSTPTLARSLPPTSGDVITLPTVPDPSTYPVSDQRAVEPRVVWAGTNGGLPYLDPLAKVFGELARSGVGSLSVVSSAPWSGPAEFVPWSLAEEASIFSGFAVGIMPLPDTPFTRAKAGFKLLQYMAAGVPVIASPVGINEQLVKDSGAGLTATTPAEWHRALARLLTDTELRVELGQRGRAFVESYADLRHQGRVIADLLRG